MRSRQCEQGAAKYVGGRRGKDEEGSGTVLSEMGKGARV